MNWYNVLGIKARAKLQAQLAMNKVVVMSNGMKPQLLLPTLDEIALVRPSSLSSAVGRVACDKPSLGS